MVGLVVGVLAVLPPYVGPGLHTAHRVEVVDHVIPGLVVLGVSAAMLVASRLVRVPDMAMLGAGLMIVLGGLWMAATHVLLIAQAARHDAPWGASIYHCAIAATVLVFGLVWTKAFWAAAG